MKKLFTSFALVYLVSACAPAKQENIDSASGLSSVTIGTFQSPAGKPAWKKMMLTIATLPARVNPKKVPFDLESFKAANGGKATNDTIKLPKGDYEFYAEYFDAAGKAVYRSCKADAKIPRHIEGKTAAVKIVVCPVEEEVPAGSTDVLDTAVSIEVVLGKEEPTCAAFVTGEKYKAGTVVSFKNEFFKALKDTAGKNPQTETTLFAKVADCSGKAIPTTPTPAPAPTGDVTKGNTTLAGTCSGCHNSMGLGAKVILNASVIPKLDNTQKDALKPYHLVLKAHFEGDNRKNLEAALKLIK